MKNKMLLSEAWRIIFTIAVIFGFPELLFASHISMVPEINMKVGEEWVEVSVKISNRGDEDSLVVFPTLRLGNAEVRLDQVPHIAFGGARHWNHRFLKKDLGLAHEGAYPLFLMITYHDANMYPYSMPEVKRFNYGAKIHKTPLRGSLAVSEIRAKGDAALTLENTSSHPIAGTYTVFTSKELTPENREKNLSFLTSPFSLQAAERREISFEIQNHGALQGSSYKVFCVAEFVSSGVHHTFVISDIARVTETAITYEATSQIIGGSIFIALLFLITAYLEIRKAGKIPCA